MNEDGQVIALAGVLQAARLVVDLAYEGRCDEAAMQSSLDSVLRIDASTPAVLHLERKLARRPEMLAGLRRGIEAAARDLGRGELAADGLAERLGGLYGETLSTLKPRVIVQGNGVHLSQPQVVARIRAALLAAVRGAVLWRQMGGNHLRLFFGRRRLAARARELRSTIG